MTDTILRHPVSGPSAWKAGDFAGDKSWIRTFSPQELDELDAATAKLRATGLGPEQFRGVFLVLSGDCSVLAGEQRRRFDRRHEGAALSPSPHPF